MESNKKKSLKTRIKLMGKVFIPLSWRPVIKASLKKVLFEIPKKLLHKDQKKVYTYNPTFDYPSIEKKIASFQYKPVISILVPVYNVDPIWLTKSIESVKKQLYPNWELCLVDDCSTNKKTKKVLQELNHPNIKISFLSKNVNISAASNEAISMSTGDYIGLLDNDDELTPDALFEVVKAINQTGAEFIYSDEDKLDMKNRFCDPHFKPDFSIDLLLSQNYICHFTVIKKNIVEQVGGFEIGMEGSQDHDLFLKCVEKTTKIHHIPKVLYHWRMIPGSTASEFSSKSYAQTAGLKAVQNYLNRNAISATALNSALPGTYRVKRNIQQTPLVSIIIPFKDKPELLSMCIDSILSKSTYQNFEIIGISNNSNDQETHDLMKSLEKRDYRIKFYEYNIPFNFSSLNNYAVGLAKGEHLILLNNDIEIISNSWIESMLEYSIREDVGAVGAKLYYPNDSIQHAGVIIGIGGVAGHSHKLYPRNHHGYFSRLQIAQNLSAVTAACLMVKKSLYEKVSGLDEKNLTIAFNDVDFCLRLRELNYLNIYTPYCEAYHHESISRGAEDNPEKIKRFQSEVYYMQKRHQKILAEGDPYYNKNLSLVCEDFSIKFE